MVDWTGLAGASGLAAALEEIQGRRLQEAKLQRELTQGQGEWTPGAPGRGGVLGFFDALLGYNKPGEIGFGGQRYKFEPYPKMTEEDVRGLGLTLPQEVTIPGQPSTFAAFAPPGEQPRGFGAPAAALAGQTPGMSFAPADLTAAPFVPQPAQRVTREMPLPGFVGQRLDPKTRQALALERFKEHRDLAKLREEYRLASQGLGVGGGETPEMRTPPFVIPGTETATGATAGQTPAQPAPGAGAAPKTRTTTPLAAPTPDMEAAIAEAHRLYPTVRPELIRAVMATESNFDPQATSPKGAQGLMQMMPGTQKQMGVTDPFDIRQNVRGGTRYLSQLLATYKGNEELALAAYNAGPGRVAAAGGKIPDLEETRAFVPKVLERAKPGALAQAPAPAPAPAQTSAPAAGGTGMQVAGPGAPAPPTARSTPDQDAAFRTSVGQPPPNATPSPSSPAASGTTTSAPSAPQAPAAAFAPSAELVTRVDYNKRQMAANDQRIQQLEAERRMAQVQARRNMPGAADRLRMYSEQQTDLRKQNKELFEDSQKAYNTEHGKWADTQTKKEEEQRKPPLAGDVKASEMNVTTDPELRNLTRDLADKGIVGNADYNKNSEADKAIVIRTAKKYADNKQLVQNLDEPSKAALSQILADDKTPVGEVSAEQITRAREQGAERVKQQKYDQAEATRLAETNAPMREFALKYFHPTLLRVADGSMSVPEAEKAGYRLMPVENQKTLMTAKNSMSQIDRVNTLLFGGPDTDGSITGTPGETFAGIYPTLEKGRSDTQSVVARMKMTLQLKKGIFQGTEMGQWARALDNYIKGTLGALSRDLGGERGHFTDFDARRIQGLFADLQTNMFSMGPMTSSGEAKKLMRQVTATISDRVRTSQSLRRDDALPWDVQGKMRSTPAPGGTSAPAGQTPTPQAPVPTPPAGQEPAQAPTSQRPNAPAAAQPDARLKQLEGRQPDFPGQQLRDNVTGITYQHNGTTWVPVSTGGQ